ncbi:hypothetical protein [Sporosarcina sp. G11-34]|uniref:hypothetical protein n=1 Tax=Sporosarcina sp. G11-34 TaxID=2849605 RepID=UPI0022A9035C|nr:hypothetical protein [Sporosarcina sp. G11-34]MCZ2260826.1 hypothetical protein [Sporosarcina sp. G11-34]
MGLFFEKASNQSKTQKVVLTAFMALVLLDMINNLLFHHSWFSVIAVCLYIVFIITFIREIKKGKNKKNK